MYYIVGLGNPGEEYELTRHNVGRMAVEYVEDKLDLNDWKTDKVVMGQKIKGEIAGESAIFILPDTFMNKSGQSVAPLINSLTKQATEKKAAKLIVVHDDLDLPIGKIKIAFNRGSGGHKGIESIKRMIKTEAFIRIKIGVLPTTPTGKTKKPKGEEKVVDFILGKFQTSEMDVLKKTFKDVKAILETIVTEGLVAAYNKFN